MRPGCLGLIPKKLILILIVAINSAQIDSEVKTMMARVLNDPDSHIMELPDFLTEYADPAIRHRLPALLPVRSLDVTLAGLPDNGKRGHSPETVAELKALGDQILRGPKWYAALGAFNSKERGAVLDALGIQRQVIFSSFAAATLFACKDREVRYGGVRAFNRAMKAFVADEPRLSQPVFSCWTIPSARRLNSIARWPKECECLCCLRMRRDDHRDIALMIRFGLDSRKRAPHSCCTSEAASCQSILNG